MPNWFLPADWTGSFLFRFSEIRRNPPAALSSPPSVQTTAPSAGALALPSLRSGDEELYDLRDDPNKWMNAVNNPVHAQLRGQFLRRLTKKVNLK